MHKQSYICKAKSATFGNILKKQFTRSQTIQNVDEFVPSHLQNLLTCSPIHPLQRMGVVRMRVQKAD